MKTLFSSLEAQHGEDFNWFLLPENKTFLKLYLCRFTMLSI